MAAPVRCQTLLRLVNDSIGAMIAGLFNEIFGLITFLTIFKVLFD